MFLCSPLHTPQVVLVVAGIPAWWYHPGDPGVPGNLPNGKVLSGVSQSLKDLSVARSVLDPEVPWTGDKASLGALRVD